MKLDKLKGWLSIIANTGVLIGIIVLAVELQQTQTSMLAEASTTRAVAAFDIYKIRADNNIGELMRKVEQDQELSPRELALARQWVLTVIRYYESLHYRMQLGVLDNETWEGTLRSITLFCSDSLVRFTLMTEIERLGLASLRDSFIELISEDCDFLKQ